MKRWVAFVIVAVVLMTIPAVALAASQALNSNVDRQVGVWRSAPISTTSRSFVPIAKLGARICATGEVSATVSLEGNGRPMDVRVLVDYGATIQPGPIRFVPVGSADSASFTFMEGVGTFEGYDGHSFTVEWRSPSGAKTTLQKATMNLVYQEGTHHC